MDMWFWIVLVSGLLLASLGCSAVFGAISCVCVLVVGGFLSLRIIFLDASDDWWSCVHCPHLPMPWGCSPKILEHIPPLCGHCDKSDKRITGSIVIDDQVQIIIKYFIRDFILPWYSHISSNLRFINQLQKSLQQTLMTLSNRCKATDWVSYLTTQLVDDVAGHLHLFREAREAWKTKGGESVSIIDQFFDREAEKEKDICRDNACTKPDIEKDYLSDLVDILLHLLAPADDFANAPLKAIVVEVLVSAVLLPVINVASSPDFINCLIVWACSEFPVTSEIFVAVIKGTNHIDELEAVKKTVLKELASLRSQDSGGRDEGTEVKLKIGSLEFLKQIIDTRINRLDRGSETDSIGLPKNFEVRQTARGRLFQLPLEAILKNSLTLDYFLNYMTSIDFEHYVNLYLNTECWKTSVRERLRAIDEERQQNLELAGGLDMGMPGVCVDYFSAHDLSSHKEEAEMIYEQYLSEKAFPRVMLEEAIIKRLVQHIRFEKLQEDWFDEVHSAVFTILEESDSFLPAFKRSVMYLRLLDELDLLKDTSRSDEEDSQSLDDVSVSFSEQGDEVETNLQNTSQGSSQTHSPQPSLHPSPSHTRTPSLSSKPYIITARITGSEILKVGNKSHAIYRLYVLKRDYIGQEDLWHVFRRYSEFYDLYLSITQKFVDLSTIPFPSKKMLNNLAAWFLEKRMNELNGWLAKILSPPTLQFHPGLQDMLHRFLDPAPYPTVHQANLAKKVEDSLVAPLRVAVKSASDAVRTVPDTVMNTVDGMVHGISKRLSRPSHPSHSQSSAELSCRSGVDLEGEENIPLMIILVLMDEVFELRNKDRWFRRRIILFLQQILNAMFGDIVNRRIVEFVEYITSPEQVAEYIRAFKNSVWPNGKLSPDSPERDSEAQLRTKVAARMSLLACLSDELRAILGSQTTSRGVLGVYECLQWQALNKRLIYVLLQGVIEALFQPYRQLPSLIRSLHSGSPRVISKSSHHSRRSARLAA